MKGEQIAHQSKSLLPTLVNLTILVARNFARCPEIEGLPCSSLNCMTEKIHCINPAYHSYGWSSDLPVWSAAGEVSLPEGVADTPSQAARAVQSRFKSSPTHLVAVAENQPHPLVYSSADLKQWIPPGHAYIHWPISQQGAGRVCGDTAANRWYRAPPKSMIDLQIKESPFYKALSVH